jgi:hypothetical protein
VTEVPPFFGGRDVVAAVTEHAIRVTTGDRAVPQRPTRSGAKYQAAAEKYVQARNRVDLGRPASGLKLATRALERLNSEHLPDDEATVLRSRILVTMADAQVELGQIAQATTLLDEQAGNPAGFRTVVRHSRLSGAGFARH